MDWGTIGASVLGSGLVGGVVSWLVARRESEDRQAVILLEREKWEHQRTSHHRERATAAVLEALEWLEEMRFAMNRLVEAVEYAEQGFAEPDSDAEEEQAVALNRLHERYIPVASRLAATDLRDARAAFESAWDQSGKFIEQFNDWLERDAGDALPETFPFEREYARAVRSIHADWKNL